MALYAGPFFCALSFAAYLFAAIYVDEDRKKVEMAIKSKHSHTEYPRLRLQSLIIFQLEFSEGQMAAGAQNLVANTQVPNNENVENGSDEEPSKTSQQVPSSQQSLSQNNKNLIGYANPLIQASAASGSNSTN